MKTNQLGVREIALVVLMICIISISAGFIGYHIGTGRFTLFQTSQGTLTKKDLYYTYSAIDSDFYGKYTEHALIAESIKGMLTSLHDKNSYFLTPKEYKKMLIDEQSTTDIVYQKVDSNHSYIKIAQFSPSFDTSFTSVATKIKNDKPKTLIIDLRNNLGGTTDKAIFLLNQFLDKGTILTEEFKEKRQNRTYTAEGKAPFKMVKVLLLVNKETSSAAEIVTAAFKENERAKIVGETTYGKGTIGQFYDLPNGGAINLTIGRWLTPKGNWIQKKGIQPDYFIKDDFSNGQDAILIKAVTL